MNRLTLVVTLAAACFVGAPALADDTLEDTRSGVRLTIPAGWGDEKEVGETYLIFGPADHSMGIFVWVHPADDWDALKTDLKWLRDELGKLLEDPEYTQEAPVETEGTQTWSMSGTATYEREPVEWEVSVIQGKRPVLVLAVVTDGKFEAHKQAYRKIVASVKPIEEEHQQEQD